MKKHLSLQSLYLFILNLILMIQVNGQSVSVTKTNPMKVYIHYMPWFTAPENPGQGTTNYGNGSTGTVDKWGQHWSVVGSNTRYPDNLITVTDHYGNQVQTRDICAHYHPLIGPYNGKDTAVLEYHLLLMKLSGIDGVLIDWYGKGGNGVNDAAPLLNNSNALIGEMGTVGLKFGLIMEDAGWKSLAAATDNGTYAINNYFSNPQCLKLGDLRGSSATNAGSPVLGVFGPQKFKTPGQWNTILSGNTGAFIPLFNQSAQIGADAAGEFAWPYPQAVLNGGAPNAWYTNLSNYYNNQAGSKNIVLGSAFPGFNDFYGTNGAAIYGIIPRTYGGTTTLSSTLALNTQYKSILDGIQLATWNDFSEGTIIEPTIEEGFQSLDTIQRFTGVPYTEADLQEVYRLFTLRKKYATDYSKQLQLNEVFNFFTSLQIPEAIALMDIIDNVNAPKISVSSTGSPSENGETGSITIKAANLTSDVTVYYTTGGTRTVSSYASTPALTGSVVLTPTNSSVTFTIAAVDDAIVNPKQTVVLQLSTDAAYNITGADKTSLTVTDNEIPPCSGPMIVNTVSVPKIDGAVDLIWAKAPSNLIGKTISGTIQTGSTWQAMFDTENLYLLVQVKDSTLSNIGTSVWDQDGIEVYLAGNNSKAGGYTANEHQYRFNWNVLPYSKNNISGNTGSTTGIVYAIPTTTTGYTLEVSIPWTSIGGTPPYNLKQIGFDINLNDQKNNSGQREATVGWNSTNSDNYQNSANFGTVELTACNADILPAAPVISSVNSVQGKEDYAFHFTILASNTPDSYSATGLPAGLTIDVATGVISGIPAVWGDFNVAVSSTNATGTDSKLLSIHIESTPAVKFASISAVRNTLLGNVGIQWIVDSEIVIKQYEVQRSTDGVLFTTIHTVTTIENTNMNSVAYNITDADPSTDDIYYRIIGTSLNDNDAVCFSPLAKVDRINTSGVYPNPVTGNVINIPFSNSAECGYTVHLLNSMGQVVYSAYIQVHAGGVIYPLQFSQRPAAGSYQLELVGETGIRTLYKVVFVNN